MYIARIWRSLLVIGVCVTAQTIASDFATFQNCISSQGTGQFCRLDPGTYTLLVPLRVERAGITVQGLTLMSETRLTRGSTNLFAMMEVLRSNVTISRFTFNGNRALAPPLPPEQADDYIDLDIKAWVGGITVEDCIFENAMGFAMSAPNTSQPGNIWIADNLFVGGRLSAIYTAGPTDIWGNHFEDFGSGAVNLSGVGAQVQVNTFYRNHREWPYPGNPGGQLFISRFAQDTTVASNWFDGGRISSPNGDWTAGIEGYGTGHDFLNNQLENHSGPGMYITGGDNIDIKGDDPLDPWDSYYVGENNTQGWGHVGISITTYAKQGEPELWTSENVLVDGVRVAAQGSYAHAVAFRADAPGTTIQGAHVTSANVFGGYTSPEAVCKSGNVLYLVVDAPYGPAGNCN